ncbi:MAG: cytochrome c [Actinomycetia bacterium]|nr:cytochrome c [Actinomycetes bacterium]
MKTTRMLIAVLALVALIAGACGGGSDDGGDESSATSGTEPESEEAEGSAEEGQELYLGTCVSCHGPEAEGLPGLGLPLVDSDFVASTSSADLVAFVKSGRSASDPENTTGVDMPVKGGNPALNDEDIVDIVAYLKSIN